MHRYEFHTHSTFSDGELLPSELARRAAVKGIKVLAITDHVGWENFELVISSISKLRDKGGFGLELICGVEITHVPPRQIESLARAVKSLGNILVIVHGESPVEPVAPGTNRAAVEAGGLVDILAHPGFITPEEAGIAAENGVMVEITSRNGHNMTNGYIQRVATEAGARLLVNSDAHAPSDILDAPGALKVLLGAGAHSDIAQSILVGNARLLAAKFVVLPPFDTCKGESG